MADFHIDSHRIQDAALPVAESLWAERGSTAGRDLLRLAQSAGAVDGRV